MISEEICRRVLQKAVSTGADFAELFAEHTLKHSVSMVDNRVDNINDTVVAGAAVRVYKGLRSVMATTVDKSEAGLLRCAEKAAEALGQGSAGIEIVLREQPVVDLHPVKVIPSAVPNSRKIDILKSAYFAARDYHEAVRQVTGGMGDTDRHILIANSVIGNLNSLNRCQTVHHHLLHCLLHFRITVITEFYRKPHNCRF